MTAMPSAKHLVNAKRDPSVALMALATNSGLGRFSDASQLTKEWTVKEFDMEKVDETILITPSYISNIMSELEKNVTLEDHACIYEHYQYRWNLDAKFLAFASCGMKNYAMGSKKHYSVPIRTLNCLRALPEFIATLANVP
jgi:hypothetical protein